MATSIQIVQTLMKKIQALPRERIAEVEDFVDFLKTRAKRRKVMAVDKSPLDSLWMTSVPGQRV